MGHPWHADNRDHHTGRKCLSPCCPYCNKYSALKNAGRYRSTFQTTQTFNCVPAVSSGPIKKAQKGFRLIWDEEAMAKVAQWFQQQPGEFFAERIHQLMCQ
jgi:hypothetical protein